VIAPLTDAIEAGPDLDAPAWLVRCAGWPDDLAGWGESGAALAGPPAGPGFVGRAAELGWLSALLAEATAGTPRVAVIEGEAGLGKSSLITAFLAGHLDTPVLAASGDAAEQELPWGMVRQLAHRADGDLLTGFPLLAGGPVASADPLSVGEELLGLLAAGSAAGGLVVVIEDLQWADQLSARALLFACRRLAGEKVLVIGSGRPQHLSHLGEGWARFLTGDRRCARLALPRLSPAELTELATALGRGLPAGGLSGRGMRRVADHSRGNPLFARAMLTELPGHVLEGPDNGLYLPRSLAAVILPRLNALPAAARNLVIAASVLGEQCAVSDAAVLAGVPEPDLALDHAVAAGFLAVQPGHRGLRFSHELIRRAVYADITATRRRSLHRWAAAMTDGPDSLSHRVAAAGGTDLQLALELDAAAALAARRGEIAPAAAYLVQAAELGARGPGRASRLLSAFELLVRTGDASGAEEMLPLVEHLPASTRRDTALGQLAMLRARPATAEPLFLAAWAAHRQAGRGDPADDEAAAEAAAGLALLYGHALSADQCRMWARRSMITAGDGIGPAGPAGPGGLGGLQDPGGLGGLQDPGGPQDPGGLGGPGRLGALAALAMARAVMGEAAAALKLFSFLPPAAALVPDCHADALTVRGMLRLWTGDLPGADADLTAVVTRIRLGLRPRYPGQALGYLAETAFRLGRWDEAQAHAELAVSMAEDAGRRCDLPFAHNVAARVAAFRGEWELASAHVSSAEHAARAAGTPAAMGFAAAARSVLGLARDDPAEVLQATPAGPMARAAGPGDDPTTCLWRPALIWALLRSGRLDEATAAVDAFEASSAACDDRQALVHSARLRAGVARAAGDLEQAEGILEAHRALADGLGIPIAQALFNVEYGLCLARAHRRPAALARLRSAHEMLAGLGARPFADAVAAELAALGLRGRPDADPGLIGLTAQERQVARLVADGMSNREAAAQLYLSPKTIEYHLAHIFAKLGIKTRYQLAARAATAGLSGPEDDGHPGPARAARRPGPARSAGACGPSSPAPASGPPSRPFASLPATSVRITPQA
jgi:DNA-binding CsgD family transcriptional regulator